MYNIIIYLLKARNHVINLKTEERQPQTRMVTMMLMCA